jgi:phenylalanyl-tRNA synthetase alpha chain
LSNPIQTIKDLTQSALGEINAAATLADLEKVRVAALGRKGELAGISKTFGSMAPEDRAKAGQLLNEAKATLEKAFDDRKAALHSSESDQRFKSEWIDLTVPPQGIAPGHIHPVTQVS